VPRITPDLVTEHLRNTRRAGVRWSVAIAGDAEDVAVLRAFDYLPFPDEPAESGAVPAETNPKG
jgi:hypothetical protein